MSQETKICNFKKLIDNHHDPSFLRTRIVKHRFKYDILPLWQRQQSITNCLLSLIFYNMTYLTLFNKSLNMLTRKSSLIRALQETINLALWFFMLLLAHPRCCHVRKDCAKCKINAKGRAKGISLAVISWNSCKRVIIDCKRVIISGSQTII